MSDVTITERQQYWLEHIRAVAAFDGNLAEYTHSARRGLGHVMKVTPEMGNPIYECEYADQYMKRSPLGLLALDLKITWRGIKVIVQGKAL